MKTFLKFDPFWSLEMKVAQDRPATMQLKIPPILSCCPGCSPPAAHALNGIKLPV